MSNTGTFGKRIGVIFAVMVAVLAMCAFDCHAATAVKDSYGYVNSTDGVILREKASTSSGAVATIADNTKLTIKYEKFDSLTSYSRSHKWFYVNVSGKSGYVRSDLVDRITFSSVSATITGKVNYRMGPGVGMKLMGSFAKGDVVKVCRKAYPYGSSTVWYRVYVDGKYRYISSKYATLGTSSATPFKPMTEAQFETYMTQQGFPDSYKSKLRALHKAHPNWTFVAQKVGCKWSDAVAKEHANGVSLIQSVHPKCYRDLGSSSYNKGSGRTIYKKPSTGSTKLGTLADATNCTILGVKEYKGTTFYKIKTSAGTVGFVKGKLTYMKFSKVKTGVLTKDLNVRSIPSTSGTKYTTYSGGTKVTVVAPAENSEGKGWYMIKYGSSFGFVSAAYVKIDGEIKKVGTGASITAKSAGTISAGVTAPEAEESVDMPEVTEEAVEESEETEGEPEVEPEILDEPIEIISLEDDQFVVAGEEAEEAVSENSEDIDAEVLFEDEQELIEAQSSEEDAAEAAEEAEEASDAEDTAEVSEEAEEPAASDEDEFVVIEDDEDEFYVIEEPETKTVKAEASDTTTDKFIVAMTDQLGLGGTGKLINGTFKAKDGSTWFNAHKSVVAYYLDPRNFLNEDRVYMFETLSYNSYQTQKTVEKVLAGTQFVKYNYKASWFYDYGKQYKISPVFLASRARQETGGGSVALSGYRIGGVYYYNPFNIGAYSSANPVVKGMYYAKDQGWNTKEKAVKGGAKYLAGSYVSNKQDTLYTQKFNVANGVNSIATHQYMTNIMAPYSESLSVKNAYKSYGITDEQLVFKIPVYTSMPSKTQLP